MSTPTKRPYHKTHQKQCGLKQKLVGGSRGKWAAAHTAWQRVVDNSVTLAAIDRRFEEIDFRRATA
jgi:AMMECR1 domain-containing protein